MRYLQFGHGCIDSHARSDGSEFNMQSSRYALRDKLLVAKNLDLVWASNCTVASCRTAKKHDKCGICNASCRVTIGDGAPSRATPLRCRRAQAGPAPQRQWAIRRGLCVHATPFESPRRPLALCAQNAKQPPEGGCFAIYPVGRRQLSPRTSPLQPAATSPPTDTPSPPHRSSH